jgi:hypothetical protein
MAPRGVRQASGRLVRTDDRCRDPSGTRATCHSRPRLLSLRAPSAAALAVLATLALAACGGASAAAGWTQVRLVRHRGLTEATLSYEMRRDPQLSLWTDKRRVRLVVRRAGTVEIDYHYPDLDRGGKIALALEDVWGDGRAEALMTMWTGGNHCCIRLWAALSSPARRVLVHDFPFGQKGQRHDGRFDFITVDLRFMCVFASCAGSSTPIQILAIDRVGRRFIDVTRTRRDLVAADAAGRWREYLDGRDAGVFAPWCADQYLLGRRRTCERALARDVRRGYLRHPFPRQLHLRLAKWGYS